MKSLTPQQRQKKLERLGTELLTTLGYDPKSPAIKDTPKRWARWWVEFFRAQDGENLGTVFTHVAADQMVVVSGMRVWSLCEHHLLPFYCDISVGYIPNGKVLGLSKFARIAHHYAHRLQIQERLVHDIADEIIVRSGCQDVAVIAQGEHLCMTMRGIRTQATMTSSAIHGAFRLAHVRSEFLSLLPRRTP